MPAVSDVGVAALRPCAGFGPSLAYAGAMGSTNEERAIAAWGALLRTCASLDGSALIMRESPAGRKPAAVWPLGQAIVAATDLVALGHDRAHLEGLLMTLRRYRDSEDGGYSPTPGARRRFFDDNAWIGLAFAQLHLQTADERFFRAARRALGFVRRGEDPKGGVRWAEGRRSIHTCATAPAAQLALRIHEHTGAAGPLTFAVRCLDWLDVVLRRPDGLYADRIDRRGRVTPAVWSYNQGTAVGAHRLRWLATGERESLERAVGTASAALVHLSDHDRLWRQPPVFNAIGLRNLMALGDDAPGGLDQTIDAYLDRAWNRARDARTGLFTDGGIGSYDGGPAIDQAGLVQLFALRAWPRTALDRIC